MTIKEMYDLIREYGEDLCVDKAYHCHDEDAWNEFSISYKGIPVGSELVSADSVRQQISNAERNIERLRYGHIKERTGMTHGRMEYLFDKMIDHLAESTNNESDLIDVLHGIGFTDDEISENVELF